MTYPDCGVLMTMPSWEEANELGEAREIPVPSDEPQFEFMSEKSSLVVPFFCSSRGKALSLFAVSLLALSCSSDKRPAGATLGDEQTGCVGAECGVEVPGGTCSSEEPCSAGSYCSSTAHCADDCSAGSKCSVCNADGHCLGGFNTFGSTVLLEGDVMEVTDAAPPACVDLDVEFERVTPTVALLIDQSGTMLDDFPQAQGGPRRNRWETVVDALTAENSFVKRLSDSVRFGLALYTSFGGYGNSGNRECPVLTQTANISLGAYEEMKGILEAQQNGPKRDTPTAESITAIAAQLAAFTEEGPKSIILATDGVPDSCDNPNPDLNGQVITRAASVAAVAAASAQGIVTRVISVGDDVGLGHLKDLAVAGAGGDNNAEAFQALDTQALENAFNEIIGSVRTCDFELGGTVQLAEAQRGTVVLDGQTLEFGDANGWEMPNEQTVRLLGQACETAQNDAAELTMKFPCDVIELLLQ